MWIDTSNVVGNLARTWHPFWLDLEPLRSFHPMFPQETSKACGRANIANATQQWYEHPLPSSAYHMMVCTRTCGPKESK